MKKITRIIAIMFALVLAFGVFGCVDPKTPETPLDELDIQDSSAKVTLRLALMFNNASYITYNNSAEFKAANGVTYKAGQKQIKPVWSTLASNLNFDIVDKSIEMSESNVNNQWTKASNSNFSGIDMIVGTANNINDLGVTNGTFLNIAPYLDQMPNVKAFLAANPEVAKSIYTGDKLFFTPYFDGYDDIERMFMMRADWVAKLLDEEGTTGVGTTEISKTAVVYQPFLGDTVSYTVKAVSGTDNKTNTAANYVVASHENIIKKQNTSIAAGITGGELLAQFRTYMATVHGDRYKDGDLSEHFVGVNAAYDPDELVALFRVIKYNPKFFSTNATASESTIVPFYPRHSTADRVMDVARLAQIFGVRGVDGRNDFFFIDKDNNLKHTLQDKFMLQGLNRVSQLYKEGLIYQDIDKGKDDVPTTSVLVKDSTIRGYLNEQDLGFMTYDYNQTSTVNNQLSDEANKDAKQYIAGFKMLPVLPPFTRWEEGKTDMTRYTESWRAVKPDGWAILNSASSVAKARMLKLMDYLYSEEGNTLMSYGPKEWVDQTATFEYNGEQVPKLSAAALKELQDYANGNYTNYYRQFLGGTFPVGYIKQQGMEQQCTHVIGQEGLNNILRAIALGTMSHAIVTKVNAGDANWMRSVPTTLPLTKAQRQMISNGSADYKDNFENTSSKTNTGWAKLIMGAWDISTDAKIDASIASWNSDFGMDIHVEQSQVAYNSIKSK